MSPALLRATLILQLKYDTLKELFEKASKDLNCTGQCYICDVTIYILMLHEVTALLKSCDVT